MESYHIYHQEAVLLVIDLQERLLKVMDDQELVVRNTNIMLELAQLYNIPVIVTEQYPKGLGQTVDSIAQNLGEHRYLEKITFSAHGLELKKLLQEAGRSKILVVGCETHVCVFQTVRDLVADQYVVYVLEDAVCSRFPLNHRNALQQMNQMGAIITNTETVVFDILGQAGTPEFKHMSLLVK